MNGQRIVICCTGAIALAGLCGPPDVARAQAVIWEGKDQSVVLVPQDANARTPNDHPVSVAPGEIESMLKNLRFRHSDQEAGTPPVAVFTGKQVGILRDALAAGLERANPSQDITFSIIGAHRLSPGAFARRNRLTAGRVFFHEGRLNLILGEIQSPYRKKNIYGRIDEDFTPRRFGSRAPPDRQSAVLAPGVTAGRHSTATGTRDDWVVYRPGDANAGAAGRPRSGAQREPPEPGGPEPRPDAAAPAKSPSSAAAASPAVAPAVASDTSDIERRLAALKRLRDKSLISEEAYRRKVGDILDEL